MRIDRENFLERKESTYMMQKDSITSSTASSIKASTSNSLIGSQKKNNASKKVESKSLWEGLKTKMSSKKNDRSFPKKSIEQIKCSNSSEKNI